MGSQEFWVGEILFTEYFSMSVGGSLGFVGSFGEMTFFSIWTYSGLMISWCFEYNRGFDQEVNFIGLKYLYSWQ